MKHTIPLQNPPHTITSPQTIPEQIVLRHVAHLPIKTRHHHPPNFPRLLLTVIESILTKDVDSRLIADDFVPLAIFGGEDPMSGCQSKGFGVVYWLDLWAGALLAV